MFVYTSSTLLVGCFLFYSCLCCFINFHSPCNIIYLNDYFSCLKESSSRHTKRTFLTKFFFFILCIRYFSVLYILFQNSCFISDVITLFSFLYFFILSFSSYFDIYFRDMGIGLIL